MQLVWFLRLANVFLIVFLSNITFVTPQDIITDSGISVAVIGDKVEMNCSKIRYFFWVYTSWEYTSWNTSTEIEISVDADDNSMRSRYKIDTRSYGQHNLIIDSVDLAHAGRYRCTTGLLHILRTDIQLIVLDSDVSNSHIGPTTLAIAGSLLALLMITVAFACVVYRKRLRGDSNVRTDVALKTDLNSYGDSNVRTDVALKTDLNSYGPAGDVNSDNEVYTEVCNPRGSSGSVNSDNEIYSEVCDRRGDSNVRPDVALNTDLNSYGLAGHVNSDNEVYTDVCNTRGSAGSVNSDNEVYSEVYDPRGSDTTSDNEVYAEVCEPKGPSNVSKGTSIGDNSRSPQIPTRERKDLIGADGTEHVELREVKPPDRKGGRYMKSVMW